MKYDTQRVPADPPAASSAPGPRLDEAVDSVLAVVEALEGRPPTTSVRVSMHDGHLDPEAGRALVGSGADVVTSWTPLLDVSKLVYGRVRHIERDYDWLYGMFFLKPTKFEIFVGSKLVYRGSHEEGQYPFKWVLCDRAPLCLVNVTFHEVGIQADDPEAVHLLMGWSNKEVRCSAAAAAWVSNWVTTAEDVDEADAGKRIVMERMMLGMREPDHDLMEHAKCHDCVKFLPDVRTFYPDDVRTFYPRDRDRPHVTM